MIATSKKLNLAQPLEADESDFGVELSESMPTHLTAVRVNDALLKNGNTLQKMQMPQGELVMMIKRGKEYIVSNGTVEIKKNDTLLIIKNNPGNT